MSKRKSPKPPIPTKPSASLGQAQKAHFDRMTLDELKEARSFSIRQMDQLGTLIAGGGVSGRDRYEDHERRIQYIDDLLRAKKAK